MLLWNFDIADKWCYIRAKYWFIACSVRLKFVSRDYLRTLQTDICNHSFLMAASAKKEKLVMYRKKEKITTWKFLRIERLESGETSSVTWSSSEQWRCLLYKIKAFWECSSREKWVGQFTAWLLSVSAALLHSPQFLIVLARSRQGEEFLSCLNLPI